MPVYTNLVGDEVAHQLGLRIRQERLRCGWTLKGLASRVAASVSTLSAIENQQVWPAVELLFQLGEAFGVSLDALLVRGRASYFQITRRVELNAHPPAPLKMVSRTSRGLTAYHNRLWPLADAFVGKYIEPFEIEIQPLRDHELRFISHTHEEFVFVLHGELEVLIKSPQGLIPVKLGAGDCTYFWSYLPHCIRSTTTEPARSVHVLTSLEEPVDSETAEWVSGPVIYMMEAPYKSPVEMVAARIVSLRRARGMSAVSFAKHTDISIRRLARIERGKGPLSLKLLLHICRTFRKPPDYFLAGALVPKKVHCVDRARNLRKRAEKPVDDRPLGKCFGESSARVLAAGFDNRRMFPSLVSLDRSRQASVRMNHHPGQEFVYVLKGEVSLSTRYHGESTAISLSPGDSCLLDSSVSHSFMAASLSPYGSARAEVLTVRWRPLSLS
jgi:transcriptional regulator with XRE-family HTH domain